MPSKKKKYNARFPPARIKKIMQTDEEVGKVAATVPVIISRALELFIESLIVQASQTTLSKKARTLSASHLKQTIQSEKKYDFLHELVANIPDHQTEEDGSGDCTSVIENQDKSNQSAVKRPRGRPRKPRDPSAAVQKKERKRKQAKMESSEDSDSDASEETDDAVEDSEGEGEASCSSNNFSSVPSTSSGMLLMPPPTPSVPPVPMYSGMTVYPAGGVAYQGLSDGRAPPVSWSLQAPGPVGFSQMPVPVMRAGLRTAEDDDYDT